MLYPKNLEQKIGFDKIREEVAKLCKGALGRKYVQKIRFSTDYDYINKVTTQTGEFLHILTVGLAFPSEHYYDASDALKKAKIEGAFLSEEEFREMRLSLGTLFRCLEFFRGDNAEQYPHLTDLSGGVSINRGLISEIDRVIDDRGKVKDSASPALMKIRRSIISEESNLRRQLDSIIRDAQKNGYIKDGLNLTMRNGRMVIPVKSEYKRRIKGFVHDKSSTGQTVFLEPETVLELNNEIQELHFKEREEVVRILMDLTTYLRPEIYDLQRAYNFLGVIDFVRAKALFAQEQEATRPTFANKRHLEWYHVGHPLLLIKHKEENKPVIRQKIKIDSENRVLVISGPNAGGKSVCLKTVGLVQYMFQCGLLVPMTEASTMGIFDNIFIDIGDEQSMDNDLSTYSSHLTNMKHFVLHSNNKTLCLIDEFGTGTEPQFGAAIAESILQELGNQKSYGVITTHYSNLKLFADKTQGMINGAMRFDVQNLEPLYELEIGQPGSSFALEIAKKIGLPRAIVGNARQKLGSKQVNMESLLRNLEKEKREYTEQKREVKIKNKILDQQLKEYTEKSGSLEKRKREIINEARQQATNILENTNKEIEKTIKEIKEEKAAKEATKKLRASLDRYKESVKPNNKEQKPLSKKERKEKAKNKTLKPIVKVINGEISIGDFVKVKDSTTIGEVVALKGKDVQISIGALKSNIKLNRLEKISKREYKKNLPKEKGSVNTSGIDMQHKIADFNEDLDLRGKRVDEAIALTEQFIDDAFMLCRFKLRILHGTGNGVLRQVIRDYLRNHYNNSIAHMGDEHVDLGGAGYTVIQLK